MEIKLTNQFHSHREIELNSQFIFELRTEHGFTCASFDIDLNPRSMDFLGEAGFAKLSMKTNCFVYHIYLEMVTSLFNLMEQLHTW